jgi:hypothetical protein
MPRLLPDFVLISRLDGILYSRSKLTLNLLSFLGEDCKVL